MKNQTLRWILIGVASVLTLGGAAVGIVVFNKKHNAKKALAQPEDSANETSEDSAN